MMEQVVTLFEDFRENNLSYDELYNTLLSKIQQDPSFRHQAIPTLDQVQQSTPIPITHFIQLRSEIDSAVKSAVKSAVNNTTLQGNQQTSSVSSDPDATLITPLPDEDATAPNLSVATHNIAQDKIGASDPTLMATSTGVTGVAHVNGPNDVPSEALSDKLDDDEATMIMPSGTLSIPNREEDNEENSEEETVINHDAGLTTNTPPLAETLVGQRYEQGDIQSNEQPNNKNQAEAETLVGTPIDSGGLTTSEESPTPEVVTSPPKKTIPTTWIWAGASSLIIICIVIFTLTSGIFGTTSNTEVALPEPTKPSSDESWGGAPEILHVEPAAETAQESSAPDTSDTNNTPNTTATNITTLAQPIEDTPATIKTSQTKEPEQETIAVIASAQEEVIIVEKVFQSKEEEVTYFVGQINNAKNANNLAPAEKVGTATYYLVKLIKASPNSPFVSQARSQIAKAHLALAATARDGERWDEAQQHLDDAFTVRLPDSYQSE